jgi:H+-transporting ATPase
VSAERRVRPVERKNTRDYETASVDDVLRLLSATKDGLAGPEPEARRRLFGFNEVPEKKKSRVLQFLGRFWGPMPWLLEAAMVLAYVLRHVLETGIILFLLTMNAVIGFLQERGSQRALESLKKRLALKAKALRDGTWSAIEARLLVPGDIIAFRLGDIVPADAKIIGGEISVDQSILTGESVPLDARPSGVVYSGSIVKRGEAEAVVVNTGPDTYFGKTAELVRIARPKSHQEEIMMAIVRSMMYLGVAALTLVAAFSLATGAGLLSIATFAVIFLMGAVPVALPAVLTIVQSVGAGEMARKGALVSRLECIEDAASVDVICLDKTGTITENRLSVADVVPLEGFAGHDVIEAAAMASQELGEDDIDLAILAYARSAGFDPGRYRQVSFLPFDPSTKRSEAVIQEKGKNRRAVKGAPQVIISMSTQVEEKAAADAGRLVEDLSRKGNRVLAVARSEDEDQKSLRLVGLLSLADPPRPDSRKMIEEVRGMGIKPVMLTGDHIAIAREVAGEVAIGERILRMGDLRGLSEGEQTAAIEEHDGFAEIYPEDKYRIVRLLQRQGHLVGMTGDGVNDAPALKQAELGIAVSSASDVAKAAAGVVLTEPGMRVIVDAVAISRHIYQRMLTWVINKVTKVIQVVGLLTAGFFLFHNMVISLLGMALLIFANDFVTMSLATDNVKVTASPDKWNVRNITMASLVIGMPLVLEGVIGLLIGRAIFHLGMGELRTFTLLLLVFTSQFRVLVVRERRRFWSSCPGRGLLVSTMAAVTVFTLLGVYGLIVPRLAPAQVFFALGFSALFMFALDGLKCLAFRRFGL